MSSGQYFGSMSQRAMSRLGVLALWVVSGGGCGSSSGSGEADEAGAYVESVGLVFVGGEVSTEPFPVPTQTGAEPVVVSALLELNAEGTGSLVVDVEVGADSTGAGDVIHLDFPDAHVTIPVVTERSEEAEGRSIVPGWNSELDELDGCYGDTSEIEGCFPGCITACSPPPECRAWFCGSDSSAEYLEACTAELAQWSSGVPSGPIDGALFDLIHAQGSCYARCSTVVAILDEHEKGQTQVGGDSWGGPFVPLAAMVSATGYASTLPQRRLDRTYCSLSDLRPNLFGSDLIECYPEAARYWTSGPTDEQEAFFGCMVTGRIPVGQPAPQEPMPRPRRVLRARSNVVQRFQVDVLPVGITYSSGPVAARVVGQKSTVQIEIRN